MSSWSSSSSSLQGTASRKQQANDTNRDVASDSATAQRLVNTPYGRGLVLRTRPKDGIHEVELLDWQQQQRQNQQQTTTDATTTDNVINNRVHASSLSSKSAATTTTGTKNMMLYTTTDFPSVVPIVGDDVICLYGRGRVISLQQRNVEQPQPQQQQQSQSQQQLTVVVELFNWRLAHRATVKCYLRVSDVHVVRSKTLYEMDSWERVRYAQELKTIASHHFACREYKQALALYDRAVTAVRYVQHDSSSDNYLRADLLLVMITCCNNAATCCTHLMSSTTTTTLATKFPSSSQSAQQQVVSFANNALVLLDALYEKRGMQIHSLLNKEGYTDFKLFGEWKLKSLLLKATGLAQQDEYTQALTVLKQAHTVLSQYTKSDSTNSNKDKDKEEKEKENNGSSNNNNRKDTQSQSSSYAALMSQGKQLKRLHAKCIEGKRAQKKKEKQRAQAMFATVPATNKEQRSPAATTSTTTTTTTTTAAVDANTSFSKQSKTSKTQTDRNIKRKRNVGKTVMVEPNEIGSDTCMNDDEVLLSSTIVEDSKLGRDDDEYDGDVDVDELPWYQEHKEAFLLTGIVGLAALTVVLLRSSRNK